MAMDKVSVKMDPARPQHLSLAFRDLQEIPEEINTKYSGTVTELDLSHNRLPYPFRLLVCSDCIVSWEHDWSC